MPTREDCLALCELSGDEVAAIAEHDPVPELAALEMGQYLCPTPDGEARLERMIIDDIETARQHGNHKHIAKLIAVLQHFIKNHTHH